MTSPQLRVFCGHDFFGGDVSRLQAYRRKISAGCHAAGRVLRISVEPVYGNTKLTLDLLAEIRAARGDMKGINENKFWPKIDGLMRISKFALFDLTLQSGADSEVNWNVLMELGVALGSRLPFRAIVRNRKATVQRLTNLHGSDIEECATSDRLGMLVKELVIGFQGSR